MFENGRGKICPPQAKILRILFQFTFENHQFLLNNRGRNDVQKQKNTPAALINNKNTAAGGI
jgi:hypothetical protein